MALIRVARWLAPALAAGAFWLGLTSPAQAIPLFARQTGHNCQACHISYPELTAYGREFKLNGYTFGTAQPIPLAVALMAEFDTQAHRKDAGSGADLCGGLCNKSQIVQWSLFFGGKLSENMGLFGQASGGQFPLDHPSGTDTGVFNLGADNTDLRYVHRISTGDTLEPDAVVGLDINNNLTVQDVWMSVPAWRFPWFPWGGYPGNANGVPVVAAPYLDGPGAPGTSGAREVGIGVYGWWHKTFYAELSMYRKPWGIFSPLAWGTGGESGGGDQPSDVIDRYAPYYRLAYSGESGYHSWEAGVFGIDAKVLNCNPGGTTGCLDATATNHFHDTGVDAQYQYNKGDPWVFSANASYIHEQNRLAAWMNSAGAGLGVTPGPAVPDHTINELNIKGTAYYNRKYGATLGYSTITGTADANLYQPGTSGATSGDPSTSWWTLELNYLPVQNMRLSALYQTFTKVAGGSSNFDGVGNNASGFNRLSAAVWWIF